MIKCTILILCLILGNILIDAQPVFSNPGIPDSESFELYELVDPSIGRAITKFNVKLLDQNGKKYYSIQVNEGTFFRNEFEINYNDLTTISEKRTDLRTGKMIRLYSKTGNKVHFCNPEKGIDKNVVTDETNIYSPLAIFFSFRGFPFEVTKSVTFKSYIYEYGDVLTLNAKVISKQTLTVRAGTFECYKVEMSLGGWQSIFSSDKYYLFFTVDKPHIFVRYMEKIEGKWSSDELIKYNK
jgi:hypothetical protein